MHDKQMPDVKGNACKNETDSELQDAGHHRKLTDEEFEGLRKPTFEKEIRTIIGADFQENRYTKGWNDCLDYLKSEGIL